MAPVGPHILVINPSSSVPMTAAISAGLDGFRTPHGPTIECLRIPEGPLTIGTEAEILSSGLQVGAFVAQRPDADAVVIACYAQPGLNHARTVTRAPVIGIQDAAVMTAMTMVDRFGVIALSQASINRHLRQLRWLGVEHRLAGETVLTRTGTDEAGLPGDLVAAGEELRSLGAHAVIFGCASFAPYREGVEQALGLPVIDPTQAAVGIALGHVCRSR